MLDIQWLKNLAEQSNASWHITMPSGEILIFGQAQTPDFTITIKSLSHLFPLNEMTIAEAYINQEIEIEGDLEKFLFLKNYINDRNVFSNKIFFLFELLKNGFKKITDNKKIISQHYGLDNEFFLSFLDEKYHCYSQGIFHYPDETLVAAMENKLKQMWQGLNLKPNMTLLDIGGGWGIVPKYCAPKEVNTTCLTIADNSYAYLEKIKKTEQLNFTVLLEDFLNYQPEKQFDAIVIFGVIEHIPNYKLFCQKVYHCLKEGGSIYIDGSAAHTKYYFNQFAHKYIWPGAHSFLCLPELIQELLYHGFMVKNVAEETTDYGLTMKHWALRFDQNRDFIIKKYGEKIYRAFRLYLWGGSISMLTNDLQAYSIVATKTKSPGIRPNLLTRIKYFIYTIFP